MKTLANIKEYYCTIEDLPEESCFERISGVQHKTLELALEEVRDQEQDNCTMVTLYRTVDDGFCEAIEDYEIAGCEDCGDTFYKKDLMPWKYEPDVKTCENCNECRMNEEHED